MRHVLRPLAFRDVSHHRGEIAAAFQPGLAHPQLQRKHHAVLALAGHFSLDADDPGLTAAEVIGQVSVVLTSVGLGHEHADVSAHEFFHRVSEDPLCGRIGIQDAPFLVDRDNPVRGRLDHRTNLSFGVSQADQTGLEFVLQFLALVDGDGDTNDSGAPSQVIIDGAAAILDPTAVPVRADQAVLDLVLAPVLHQFPNRLGEPRAILGMDIVLKRLQRAAVCSIASTAGRLQARGRNHHVGPGIPLPDRHRPGLEDQPQPFVAPPQLAFQRTRIGRDGFRGRRRLLLADDLVRWNQAEQYVPRSRLGRRFHVRSFATATDEDSLRIGEDERPLHGLSARGAGLDVSIDRVRWSEGEFRKAAVDDIAPPHELAKGFVGRLDYAVPGKEQRRFPNHIEPVVELLDGRCIGFVCHAG